MRRMVKMATLWLAVALPFRVGAQEKVEATLGADIVSNYIWRGQDLGDA